MKTLKYDCSSGPDQIPTKSVKLVAEYLAEPLTIVNGWSILEPIMFNLYVSDLPDNLYPSSRCSQYADDTSLYKHTVLSRN
ncbi:unnamed protein product [Porites evermanni]|uniref:Reverse transcriptase domain-containing protein n=1 Tax=Porites evermanni TaxID=104178 RepID=A0ABN8QHR8_9CNID|nr:unnamed protein product [Porites evermanni]